MPLTKSEFMSKEMGGFIHRNNESNYDIAKRIVKYFDDRDSGYYAAVVNDDNEYCGLQGWIKDYKRKDVTVKNKRIQVWKQYPSGETSRMKSNFGAFCDGLIKKHRYDFNQIRDGLKNDLDGYYAVVCHEHAGIYCSFYNHHHRTFDHGYKYELWRQA